MQIVTVNFLFNFSLLMLVYGNVNGVNVVFVSMHPYTTMVYSLQYVGPAVDLALLEVHRRYRHILQTSLVTLNGTTLTKCPELQAEILPFITDLYYQNVVSRPRDVMVIVAPVCSEAVGMLSDLAREWNVPIVTAGGSDGNLDSRERYPTLLRFHPYHQNEVADATIGLLSHFHWLNVAIICDDGAWEINFHQLQCRFLKQRIKRMGKFTCTWIRYDFKANPDHERFLLEAAQTNRAFVIITHASRLRKFLVTAQKLGMANGDYVFISHEIFKSCIAFGPMKWNLGQDDDEAAHQAFQYLLLVSGHYEYLHHNGHRSHLNTTVLDELRERSKSFYGHAYQPDEEVTLFTTGYYEAVVAISQIVAEKSRTQWHTPSWEVVLQKLAWDHTFCSDLACVKLNSNGDRNNDYSIKSLPENGKILEEVFLWNKTSAELTPYLSRAIHWPNNRSAPANSPPCGFFGEAPHCSKSSIEPYIISAGGIAAVLLIAATIFGMLRYRNQALRESAWQLSIYQIIFPLNSNVPMPDITQHSAEGKATYQESVVWTRRCAHVKPINPNAEWINLINFRKTAKHDNIAVFIGCAFTPACTYVVTEYFAKGSLDQFLIQRKKWMDMSLQMSLLFDIAEGLTYIHTSAFRIHGSVKSTNCMLTDRFSIRLTDFGITFLHAKQAPTDNPEPMRRRSSKEQPSKETDIFGFGQIMLEVSNQMGNAFHGGKEFVPIMLESSAYIENELKSRHNSKARPRSATCCTLSLATKCTNEDPTKRPSVTMIRKILESLSDRDGDTSYFDLLLKKIDSYARKMEVRFHEQNGCLLQEMAKSAALLKEIFPPPIADALTLGKLVPPESFESATVIFIKIADIDHITIEAHPEILFNALNEIYIAMDRILACYDVYKIETISENYMVVSGVPVRCLGAQHAGQAVHFACAVVKSMASELFGGQEVHVCVGIHSGPLVAAIAGLRMQRYCLFGDTVNVASRLSTTCEAQKVQTSPETKQLLSSVPVVSFQCRGEIPLKGRGLMTTYWASVQNATNGSILQSRN